MSKKASDMDVCGLTSTLNITPERGRKAVSNHAKGLMK